jgi:octaprenyl-diphosphate synthase
MPVTDPSPPPQKWPARKVLPDLRRLFQPIAEPLLRTDRALRAALKSCDPAVNELAGYGCLLGGKRLRPALLLLAADATGGIQDPHYLLGAVVEMIHTATLVHDDVIDEASTRRDLPTVNARWDTPTSVLLGDFLFTNAFHLASTLSSTTACRWIGEATNRVCEGELRQKLVRGNWELDEYDYFAIIEAKTAELCAVSCRLGAHFAGATPVQVQALSEFGRLLGIAYQIVDDLIDLAGDQGRAGKSLGTDLIQQRPTLPIIRALAKLPRAQRTTLLQLLQAPQAASAPSRQAVADLLRSTDGLESTVETARETIRRAIAMLDEIPSSSSRSILAKLADTVVAIAE